MIENGNDTTMDQHYVMGIGPDCDCHVYTMQGQVWYLTTTPVGSLILQSKVACE